MGVDTGHQTLRSGLLVARGTIDLTGQEEVFDDAGFERILQILRVEVVILDSISGLEDDRVFQPGNGVHGLQLDLLRKRRGEALKVVFGVVAAFRLQEKLVGILVGKGAELVLDTRTIARSATMDNAREERRPVETSAEDIMDLLVRMEDVAVHLRERFLHAASGLGRNDSGLNRRRNIKEGEAGGTVIADLDRKLRKVEGADVDAWGCSGLHPGGRDTELGDLVGDPISRRLADAPAFEGVGADKHPTVQEGSGGQNNGPRMENCPGNCTDARQNAILKEKICGKIA
jgi:hypothetical protein